MSYINEVFIEDELKNSYLSYAMSVIIGRALPDARDGLKPVHRRILFVMKELNNTFDKIYKKSARIVGDVIGKYHPHGESAVYDSIVRLSQPFVQRYVLIDGQGNFGSIDGDSAAAMRYTEIRMSEISNFLLKDLDFSVVDFVDNYDGTEKQPIVLPSMIPNLLINGSCGIAVGMATNIPPHNLSEVIDACNAYIDNPNIKISDLNRYVLAPDFPTYGNIYGTEEIYSIYETGKGKFILRSNASIINNVNNECSIIVDQLPYQVNKSKLIENIIDLSNNNNIEGIKNVYDESDKNGLRICINLQKGKNPASILDKLYSQTKMQIVYNVNMVALVNNMPKLLNLKDTIKCFIDHRREIVYRRTKFNLIKTENKIHLMEGLCIAIVNLEKLIDFIVNCANLNNIKSYFNQIKWDTSEFVLYLTTNLISKDFDLNYQFSDIQIQSILDLKLIKLSKLEKDLLFKDYLSLLKEIDQYKKILSNNIFLDSIIKDELFFIKEKFGDTRRTKLISNIEDINTNNSSKKNNLSEKKNIIITLSEHGYIKIQLLENYEAQHRGGKGKSSLNKKDTDFINNLIICDTYDILLCFSNFGKLYWINLVDFSLHSRKSMGIHILNLLKLNENEKINFILPLKNYDINKYILMVTKSGIIKKILLIDVNKQRNNGIIIINLNKNDILIDVKLVNDDDQIILFSKAGKSLRFSVNEIKCTNRNSKGILSMKLSKNDMIISLVLFAPNSYISMATENGYGKKTNIDEFSLSKRGLKGILCIRINKKNGNLIGVEKVFNDSDLLLITTSGTISRIRVNAIPCTSRYTKGVILITLAANEFLVKIKNINKEIV